MKTREKNVERRKVRPCPIRTIGFTGNLSALSVREPLIAVMSSHEIETFRVQGLRIAAKIPIHNSWVSMKRVAVHLKGVNKVQVAVEGAHAVCTPESLPGFTRALNAKGYRAQRRLYYIRNVDVANATTEPIPALVTVPHEANHRIILRRKGRIFPDARRKLHLRASKEPETRTRIDKNGVVYLTVSYSTHTPPPVHIEYEYHSSDDGSGGSKQSVNIFLKDTYHDPQIIQALKEASLHEFGSDHKGLLRYSVEHQTYRTRAYNDNHLLVCLFFYIYVNKLNKSQDFYSCQRKKLLTFCSEQLSDSKFTLYSDSYFTRCINKLNNQRVGFENYIVKHERPPFRDENGIPDMLFWYEIYRNVEDIFKETFLPKNNKD